MSAKRYMPSEDPSSLKQLRSDDLPSVAEPLTHGTGLAKPGFVRTRQKEVLSRLPLNSNAIDTFSKLRNDNSVSDEEAFLKFITTYDVPLSTLVQISTNKLPTSSSNVKYKDIAPYVWLDPDVNGNDIKRLQTFRSRIPLGIFEKIFADVNKASLQYGRMVHHDNEEARSRFIASFFTEIVCLFGNAVVNKPEAYLDAEFTKRGRIEHHFYALNSISIVFIEIKKTYTVGKAKLDTIAQVLAECAACDYRNSKNQNWVPILAILCDGEKFNFLVYDSGEKSIYESGEVTGVFDMIGEEKFFVESLKKSKVANLFF
jgi:hypothetical protein